MIKKVLLYNPEKVVTKDEVFTSRSTEPKIREVESEGRDIVDYRIEEAKFDEEGNIITKTKPPFYEVTGRSLEWTIRKGETLKFPEYVANYLVKIYPFLEIKEEGLKPTEELEPVKTETLVVEHQVEAKPVTGQLNCKYCGAYFNNEKGLGLHIGHKHLDKIL